MKTLFNPLFQDCNIEKIEISIFAAPNYNGPDLHDSRRHDPFKISWTMNYMTQYLQHQLGKTVEVKRVWIDGCKWSHMDWLKMVERYGFKVKVLPFNEKHYKVKIVSLQKAWDW